MALNQSPHGDLFAVVVPGFPVVTALQQIDTARWTCSLGGGATPPPSFVVFLTGVAPLPVGCGVGVYVSLPHTETFAYIGCLRPDRPSGLFSIPISMLSHDNDDVRNRAATGAGILGLAIESLEHLHNLGDASAQTEQETSRTKVAFAERIVEDFYAFAASYAKLLKPYFFASPSPETAYLPPELLQERNAFLSSIETAGEEEFVVLPASFVSKWRERVMRRVQKDRSFIDGL